MPGGFSAALSSRSEQAAENTNLAATPLELVGTLRMFRRRWRIMWGDADRRRVVAPSAPDPVVVASRINALLPTLEAVPPSALASFDAQLRHRSWAEPKGLTGWFRIRPSDVAEIVDRSRDETLTAALLSMHTNGHVREAAVRELSKAEPSRARSDFSSSDVRIGFRRCARVLPSSFSTRWIESPRPRSCVRSRSSNACPEKERARPVCCRRSERSSWPRSRILNWLRHWARRSAGAPCRGATDRRTRRHRPGLRTSVAAARPTHRSHRRPGGARRREP